MEAIILFLKKLFFIKSSTPLKEIENPVTKPVEVSTGLEHPENPAYKKAKQFEGKTEFDSGFNKYLSGFWKLFGLNYKTIIGSSFAWCGLFIGAMNTETGIGIIAKGAGAKNWAKYGQSIDWKKNGVPRGAVMHLNHDGKCDSGSSNHVTFADGDCTSEELLKSGATVPGFGGNQGNTVKRSQYPVKEICAVRWPAEIDLPSKINKSVDCSGKKSSESTQ